MIIALFIACGCILLKILARSKRPARPRIQSRITCIAIARILIPNTIPIADSVVSIAALLSYLFIYLSSYHECYSSAAVLHCFADARTQARL